MTQVLITPPIGLLERRRMMMQGKKGFDFNGHDYVDLGLPSGTVWATKNIGAELVTDGGLFFSFGDVVGHDTSYAFLKNYKYATYDESGNVVSWTKYNFIDNLTFLLPEDDAAVANMGGDWKMPSKGHFQELLDNTTHEVVTRYNGTNVTVMVFTSSINGNTLVLPICGWVTNYYMHNNSFGGYRSRDKEATHVDWDYYLKLNNTGTANVATVSDRRNGMVVRGVISKYDTLT